MSDPASDFTQPDADLDPQKVAEEDVPAEKAEEHRDYSASSAEGENEAEQDAETPDRDD